VLIIDSHAHVYAEDDQRYPPVANPIRPPARTGSLSRLLALAQENSVTGLCIVQPGTFYGWDNRFICELPERLQNSAAAICSLDPDDSNSYQQLKQHTRFCGIRGLRSYPASDGHLDSPGVVQLWQSAGEEGITINVLIQVHHTDQLARMLEQFPRQPVVIDHCLITGRDSDLRLVLKSMLRLARFPNTYAKLSFLPLGSNEEYPFPGLHDTCKSIIAGYGADRCLWGSNFPCELWTPGTSYADHLRLFTTELGLPDSAKAAILGRTAHRLWFRDKSGLQ
jgi:L-fuconolactonase